MDKAFLSKLRTLTKYSDMVDYFVVCLGEKLGSSVIYLDYHRSHNLLSLLHYVGNIDFKYKLGIECTKEQAKKMSYNIPDLDGSWSSDRPSFPKVSCNIPDLGYLKEYLTTSYIAIPIKHNDNLYGLVIVDPIKNEHISCLVEFYVPHFSAFIYAFKLSEIKLMDLETGVYSVNYLKQNLSKMFDKKELSLLAIHLPDNSGIKYMSSYTVYKLRQNEFAILLKCNLKEAAVEAERIRRLLLDHDFRSSIGVSGYPTTCYDVYSLLYSAQSAMLAVKNMSKVCVAKSLNQELTL